MGKRLEWVKFHFTDWMVGVRRMSWAARGIYMEALCLQFHGERLPVHLEDWMALFPGAAKEDMAQVVERFDLAQDERGEYLVNRRLEREMNDVELRREKGRNASAKRWQCQPNANPMPHGMGEQCQPNAIEKRGEKKREEKREEKEEVLGVEGLGEGDDLITASGDRVIVNLDHEARVEQTARGRRKLRMPDGVLEDIWNLFPKKVGKKTAITLLEKAIRDYAKEWELDTLDDAAAWMSECVERMAKRYDGTDERFIPHPATWLRQGRYEDPVEAA